MLLFHNTGVFLHLFFVIGLGVQVIFATALFLMSAMRQGLRPLKSAYCGQASRGDEYGVCSVSRGAFPNYTPCTRRFFRRLPMGTHVQGRQLCR